MKFPWGELILVGSTNEFSVCVDIINPGSEADSRDAYLKKGVAMYYVIEGNGLLAGKPIKKGDFKKIVAGQNMHLKNNSRKKLKLIGIYLPPYDDANIGYKG